MFGEMSGSNVWGIVWAEKYAGKKSPGIPCPRWDPMQGYKFVCVAGMICGTLVIHRLQTDTQSYTLTDRETDEQLLTGYRAYY